MPRPHFLERELIHFVEKAKIVWLIVGRLSIKAGWWNDPLALWDFNQAINTKILTKCHPWFLAFLPQFSAFPPPDSPHSHSHSLHFLHSHPDSPHSLRSPHSHPVSSHSHSNFPLLITRVPTLVPRVLIIPLIPFRDYPFWLLQID